MACTDLSLAGKQAGMSKDSNTRSSLLWEVERILNELKNDSESELPQVLFLENVSQIHSAKNLPDFQNWIKFLNSLGYQSYYFDINSKNFGVPQNRERTFMISLLGNYDFEPPEEMPLRFCMADILENEVDEKYFLNSERAENLINQLIVEKKIPELSDEK